MKDILKNRKRPLTKLQLITKLYKDKFISDQVLWNLLGSRFKKHELELIDETFRNYREIGRTNYGKIKVRRK